MTEREGTCEPGGADEIAAAHDALVRFDDRDQPASPVRPRHDDEPERG